MPEAGRVVGGRVRGVRLTAPGAGTRPLADRVKQALFAILEPRLPGARVADLFAGSGAGGIEALSRGAAECDFVERDAAAVAVIRQNLRRSGLAGPTTRVHRADVLRFLAAPPAGLPAWDVALLDPPYGHPAMLPALELLGTGRALVPEAIVVAKHFWRDAPPATVGRLHAERTRRFGETALTFYRLAAP